MADLATLQMFDRAPMIRDQRDAQLLVKPTNNARRVPRPYQRRMIDQVLEDWTTVRATLAVQATGTGKTFCGAEVIRARLPAGPVLWLNERENLVTQVRGNLADMLGTDVFVEMADRRAPTGSRVVVASVQSMSQDNRLASYSRDYFKTIVIDECHHFTKDGSYAKVVGNFSHAKILGLTATPKRADGQGMDVVFEKTAIEYFSMEAVRDGYLIPFEIRFGEALSLEGIKKKSGDFGDSELAREMTEIVIRGMADEIIRDVGAIKGVTYAPRVDIAHALAIELNRQMPGSAMAVDGTLMDPETKREILLGHRRGDFLHLVNVGVVVEGHDDPGIVYIADGRPTKSMSSFVQKLGRPLRPGIAVDDYVTAEERREAIAASWKPFAIYKDFVGNSGKHDLISPIDCLAGEADDDAVVKEAKRILKEAGGGSPEDALQKARDARTREQMELAARVERVRGAKWKWRNLDPFSAFGMEGPAEVAEAWNRASPKQRGTLWRMGVDTPDILSGADAQRLIKAAKAREKAGLCDYGLVRMLSAHGIAAQRLYHGVGVRLREAIRQNKSWTPKQEVIQAIIGQGRIPGEEA